MEDTELKIDGIEEYTKVVDKNSDRLIIKFRINVKRTEDILNKLTEEYVAIVHNNAMFLFQDLNIGLTATDVNFAFITVGYKKAGIDDILSRIIEELNKHRNS